MKRLEIKLEDMLADVREKGYDVKGIQIDTSKLIIEERVRMNCFYCAKYNTSWRCPPRIPKLDYKKIFSEYDYAAFIYVQIPLTDSNYDSARKNSTLQLHHAMLACEKWLYENNHPIALSFIGGSCKLCKNGCAPDRCANPYLSRSPLEALGVNVVKSAKEYGIEITFPPKEYMMRIGLLLW